MKRPLVVHQRQMAFDVDISRRGPWGNPFIIGRDGDRATVIAKHKKWFLAQPALVARAKRELRGKTLGCFCRPLFACHGDTLAEVANE